MTPEQWAALNIVTETNQPHEMLPIAWVLRYRVESPRFPDTMQAVVLQERQFSAWNPWTHGRFKGKFSQEEIYHEMWKTLDQETREKLFPQALEAAQWVGSTSAPYLQGGKIAGAPRWLAPFGPEACWYYSPISMVPVDTAPTWAASARRVFTLPGIDPRRFTFCEAVG